MAEALGAPLTDVSCSGAQTEDVATAQVIEAPTGTSRLPPQIRAVDGDTDLVTLGLGGNDQGLFRRLVACARNAGDDCAVGVQDDVETVYDGVSAVLGQVQDRAARDALVVVVGYPRLAPTDQGCPAFPLPDDALRAVDEALRGLNGALSRAAEEDGALFLDLYGPSRGHDVCSDDPWINGAETLQGRALAYHPFPVEQEAVAALLGDLVDREARS